MKLIITAKDTELRLKETNQVSVTSNSGVITLNPQKTFQTMLGFGGAFTESACYNLYRVNKEVREKALRLYFDKEEGIGYTLGRVSIHSSDFSLYSYTYIDEGDKELKTFDISHEFKFVIPTIKRAQEIAGTEIKLLGSPWSPAPFMKDNNSPIRGGKLLPEYMQSWANYYKRFIQEFRKAGLNIWGITVQNEPQAVQRWDSCIYSGEEERDFVKNYLGPTIKKGDTKDVNILIWDHNRDIMVERAKAVLNDKKASKYVWGTAFHWYVSEAFDEVGKTHELFPDKGLLFSEGCIEGAHLIGRWENGERYARNMIGDINNYCEGYIDWNLFLDELGGPNHVNNLCSAPIILRIFNEQIFLESSYYYIGHISKFVKPGAKRIEKIGSSSLNDVAFVNPNGEIVYVALNETDNDVKSSVSVFNKTYEFEVPKHSIITLVI